MATEDSPKPPQAQDLIPAPAPEPPVDYQPPEDAPPIPVRPAKAGPAENLAAAPLLKTAPVQAPQPQQYKPPDIQPGSPDDTLIGRKVGPCRVDSLLGRGGMGAVYEATDLRLGRRVAVKVMTGASFGNPEALRPLPAASPTISTSRVSAS